MVKTGGSWVSVVAVRTRDGKCLLTWRRMSNSMFRESRRRSALASVGHSAGASLRHWKHSNRVGFSQHNLTSSP